MLIKKSTSLKRSCCSLVTSYHLSLHDKLFLLFIVIILKELCLLIGQNKSLNMCSRCVSTTILKVAMESCEISHHYNGSLQVGNKTSPHWLTAGWQQDITTLAHCRLTTRHHYTGSLQVGTKTSLHWLTAGWQQDIVTAGIGTV